VLGAAAVVLDVLVAAAPFQTQSREALTMSLPRRAAVSVEPHHAEGSFLAQARLVDSLRERFGDSWWRLSFREPDGLPDDDHVGWVIHLPIDVPDVHAARALADTVVGLVDDHPLILGGAVTVSPEDHQSVQHRVYCDRLVSVLGRRCGLRDGHRGECRQA
jgi:hypothetical protein